MILLMLPFMSEQLQKWCGNILELNSLGLQHFIAFQRYTKIPQKTLAIQSYQARFVDRKCKSVGERLVKTARPEPKFVCEETQFSFLPSMRGL